MINKTLTYLKFTQENRVIFIFQVISDMLKFMKILSLILLIIRILLIIGFEVSVLSVKDNQYLFVIQMACFSFGCFFKLKLHFFEMCLSLSFSIKKYLIFSINDYDKISYPLQIKRFLENILLSDL